MFTVDARALREFARDLRATDPILKARFTKALREIGQPIAKEIRDKLPHKEHGGAASRGVKVSVTAKGASVNIGGSKAPASWALAFTKGNKGDGLMWHPTFGHRYALPELQPSRPEVIEETWAKSIELANAKAYEVLTMTIDELGR